MRVVKRWALVKQAIRRCVEQLKSEHQGITHNSKALTSEQQRIQELEKCIKRLELEKEILKKATVDLSDQCNSSLDVVRIQKHSLTDQLSEQYPTEKVCELFDVPISTFYERRSKPFDEKQQALSLRIASIFKEICS